MKSFEYNTIQEFWKRSYIEDVKQTNANVYIYYLLFSSTQF